MIFAVYFEIYESVMTMGMSHGYPNLRNITKITHATNLPKSSKDNR